MNDDALRFGMSLLDLPGRPSDDGDGYDDPRRTSWTAAELLAANFPEPRWIVPDLLPVGLALLAGRPKIGKSFLALQLSIAAASGGMFLDKPVEQGGVLYIALEDSPRRFRKRLHDMGAPSTKQLCIECAWPPLNAKGLGALNDRLHGGGFRLVVVDTLTRAVTGNTDWDSVGQVTGVMGALQDLAVRHDLCLLLIDHHRKPGINGADLIDDVIGSTAKAAVADTILGLYKQQGKAGATLRVVGRDVDEQELALMWHRDTRCWQSETPTLSMGRQGLLNILTEFDRGLSCTELAELAERQKGPVYKDLQELLTEGRVVKDGNVYLVRD